MPHDVATAVMARDQPRLQSALAALLLTAAPGWPTADTADGMRPYAEHGNPAEDAGAWLLVVDGAVVGDLGWLGGPADDGDCELGYGVGAPSRGKGLGTEGVGILAAWAERQPGVARLTAEVLQGNEPSRRLLLRLGFREERGTPPYLRFSRPTPLRTRRPRTGEVAQATCPGRCTPSHTVVRLP